MDIETFNNTINPLITQHLEYKSKMDELKKQDDEVKEQVRMLMSSNDQKGYEDPQGNSVTLSESTRETLDKKKVAIILTHDQYEECIKRTPTSILKILSKESKAKMKKYMDDKQGVK